MLVKINTEILKEKPVNIITDYTHKIMFIIDVFSNINFFNG